jgi:hypothetical protein
MKKSLLVILLIGWAGINLCAQSIKEKSSVLQKCLDISEMNTYYPGDNIESSKKIIYIMQYPIAFEDGVVANKFEHSVLFKTRPEIYSAKAEYFFLFKNFDINDKSANISFIFYYDYSANKKMVEGNVVLEKIDGEWIIVSKNIERK